MPAIKNDNANRLSRLPLEVSTCEEDDEWVVAVVRESCMKAILDDGQNKGNWSTQNAQINNSS